MSGMCPASDPQSAARLDEQPLIVPLCAVFRKHLKQDGQKFTAERARVLDTVIRMERVFEPEDLLYELRRRRMRVSKATIYRTLKLLQDAGIIEPVLFDQKQTHYQLAYGQPPKDQMVCIETGRVVEISVPEITELRRRVAARLGWLAVGHRLQIFGVCPEAEESSEVASET